MKDAFVTGKGPFGIFFYPIILARKVIRNYGLTKRGKKKVYAADGTVTETNEDLLDVLIDVMGIGGDELLVIIKDHDDLSLDDLLGQVSIPLEDMVEDEPVEEWYELDMPSSKDESATFGEVKLRIEVKNIWKGLKIKVNVLEARGLRAADKNGLSDPYCILKCGNYTQKTKPRYKTLEPSFNERFVFPQASDVLSLELKDEDKFGTSDWLGSVIVPLSELDPNVDHTSWHKVIGQRGSKKATGEVHLNIKLSEKIENLSLGKAEVEITIIAAKELRAADRNGTSDPFIIARLNKEVFRTKTIYKTLDPEWNEEYTFNKSKSSKKEVEEDVSLNTVEQIQLLDAQSVYMSLPDLDEQLSREFYNEQKAGVQLQILLVVSSLARLAKERQTFNRFLRESRFKLLANEIEPPENIFKSNSYTSVDVLLVANWLLRLTPEQRHRFHQLKARFSEELQN